jgi:hypothetical protein
MLKHDILLLLTLYNPFPDSWLQLTVPYNILQREPTVNQVRWENGDMLYFLLQTTQVAG